MATNKPQGLMQRAATSLAATNHSVFASTRYIVMQGERPLPDNWDGARIEQVTVSEPTLITKSWRAHFWPNKFYAFLDGDLTRAQAQDIGDTLMEVTNMRRKEVP